MRSLTAQAFCRWRAAAIIAVDCAYGRLIDEDWSWNRAFTCRNGSGRRAVGGCCFTHQVSAGNAKPPQPDALTVRAENLSLVDQLPVLLIFW
jgi:hypothetical protein